MANKLIPWQRYLSDIAHKYVGYPDEEGGEDIMIINVNADTGALDKTYNEILEAAETQHIVAIINDDGDIIALPLLSVNDSGGYFIYFLGIGSSHEELVPVIMTAAAQTTDDYPVLAD